MRRLVAASLFWALPLLASVHYCSLRTLVRVPTSVVEYDNCNTNTTDSYRRRKEQGSLPRSRAPPAASSVVPNPLGGGLAGVLVTTRTEPAFHMFVYPPDKDRWISKRILQTGVYEAGTTRLFAEHLPALRGGDDGEGAARPCGTNLVLDLGSNLGYYSLLAAARGYDVVSFEASPDTAWLQRSSAALNGFSSPASAGAGGSLLLIDRGVSDAPSSGRMARYADSPGMTSFASNATDFDLRPGANGSALDVNIDLVRAGDVLAELGLRKSSRGDGGYNSDVCYKLLKIDVEGYELKALNGLGSLATEFPFETIIMEYFPAMLKAAGVADPMDMLRYISMQGYEFHVIKGNGTLDLVQELESDDRVKDIHDSGYHINLLARRDVGNAGNVTFR